MKLLITSFGTSHLPRLTKNNSDIFYRMPPVSMGRINQPFMPDYATLLLADKIIFDKQSYNRLMAGAHDYYGNVAVMIRALYDEGFVQLEDFDEIIAQNKDLLNKMLAQDLKEFELWVNPLKESSQYWRDFVTTLREDFRRDYYHGRQEGGLNEHELNEYEYHQHIANWLHEVPYQAGLQLNNLAMFNEALSSSSKRRKAVFKKIIKGHLTEYLSYINSNILLSQTFETGFHDWYDFKPFYQEKFLRVAKDAAPGEKESENIKKLFEVSFPEFSFWHPNNVIKALKDKRIQELRLLVESACKGEIEFDREFATRTLLDVMKIENKIGKLRKIVSYSTIPLGFIPWVGTPIQKVVEESIINPLEKKNKEGFQWFYLISEMENPK